MLVIKFCHLEDMCGLQIHKECGLQVIKVTKVSRHVFCLTLCFEGQVNLV